MDVSSVNKEVATQEQPAEKKNESEGHFAKPRQAKEKAELIAEQERNERLRLQQEIDSIRAQKLSPKSDEEEEEDDGYVDSRALKRTIKRLESDFDRKVEEKLARKLDEENRKNFMFKLKSEYPDFDHVLTEETAAKLEQANPKLAQMILNVPDEYQRRAMAYEAIKTAGLHKKAEPAAKESVQDKINQNQRSLYYIPPATGTAGMPSGDFSPEGRKAAYARLKNLKSAIAAR